MNKSIYRIIDPQRCVVCSEPVVTRLDGFSTKEKYLECLNICSICKLDARNTNTTIPVSLVERKHAVDNYKESQDIYFKKLKEARQASKNALGLLTSIDKMLNERGYEDHDISFPLNLMCERDMKALLEYAKSQRILSEKKRWFGTVKKIDREKKRKAYSYYDSPEAPTKKTPTCPPAPKKLCSERRTPKELFGDGTELVREPIVDGDDSEEDILVEESEEEVKESDNQ